MNIELNKLRTLTGMSWDDVKTKMQETLPDDAYKPIVGIAGGTLTDIDSAYMLEVTTDCFGPCGIGWGISYKPEDVVVTDQGQDKGQNRFLVSINYADFWYLMGDTKYLITTSGGSISSHVAFAIKGAQTSAIGSAVSRLLFQLEVYKGHHTSDKSSGPNRERHSTTDKSDANVGGASQKQVNYIRALLNNDIPDDWPPKEDIRKQLRDLVRDKELTAAKASQYIEQLKAVAEANQEIEELDV